MVCTYYRRRGADLQGILGCRVNSLCAILFAMTALNHFIADRDAARAFHPLRGLLSPVSESVARAYIEKFSAPDDLILDPFARSPAIARAALELGRRALAVESNPVWSGILRALASPPSPAEIDAAITRLGDALKDDAPLRAHLDQLYATICAQCRQLTPADYFTRARAGDLLRRHYTCARCGATRADTATDDDLRRAESFDPRGLHFHFALERVAPAENLYADRIKKILALYTPRNLYALVTLTLKADALFREPRERVPIALMLFHLLNRGASLYADPAPDAPAQWSAPAEFLEFNLWREFEFAARALRDLHPLDLVESLKTLPLREINRAYVARGNARTLAREIAPHSVALIVAAPPVSRVPVWGLSYFMGAWVLGRAAAQHLVAFLDPAKDAAWERRWYAEALARSLRDAARLLKPNARIVFIFDDTRHVVSDALLLAASGAEFGLESFVFQPRVGDLPRHEFQDIAGDYRVAFRARAPAPREILYEDGLATRLRAAALAGAREILARRGEPLAYAWVHHAAYTRAAREELLHAAMHAQLATPPHLFVANAIRAGLREGYAQDLDHYESESKFLWRLAGARGELPLIERVEDAVIEILRAGEIARHALEEKIYQQFPGDLTPEAGLIELCARAYAEDRAGVWHLRAFDAAAARSRDLEMLAQVGTRLEFEIARDVAPFDVAWKDAGEIAHRFVWRGRARFDDLARILIAPTRGYLLITDFQLPLLLEKTKRLPQIAEAFYEAGWEFMRGEAVEKFLQREKIERAELELLAGLERDAKNQMELL